MQNNQPINEIIINKIRDVEEEDQCRANPKNDVNTILNKQDTNTKRRN